MFFQHAVRNSVIDSRREVDMNVHVVLYLRAYHAHTDIDV